MLLKKSIYGNEFGNDEKQKYLNCKASYPRTTIDELPLYAKTNYAEDFIDKSKIVPQLYNNIDIPIPLKTRMPLDCNSTNRVDF